VNAAGPEPSLTGLLHLAGTTPVAAAALDHLTDQDAFLAAAAAGTVLLINNEHGALWLA
jgi:hypothetical protein